MSEPEGAISVEPEALRAYADKLRDARWTRWEDADRFDACAAAIERLRAEVNEQRRLLCSDLALLDNPEYLRSRLAFLAGE